MIRSCQAGSSVPACGKGPGAEHRADFSSPLALVWLCQCHNFSWDCRPPWVGMAGLKWCPLCWLLKALPLGVPLHPTIQVPLNWTPSIPAVKVLPGAHNSALVVMQPSTCESSLLFCLFFLPLNKQNGRKQGVGDYHPSLWKFRFPLQNRKGLLQSQEITNQEPHKISVPY